MLIKKIVLLAFFLSGMAALIYEVVWFRPLELIFGSSVYALSTMLTSFLCGIALGSYIFSKFADKVKNPLLTFAFIELGIAIYGVLIIYIFNWLPGPYFAVINIFKGRFAAFVFMQFILLFLVMLIPTTLMGGTWPLINKVFVDDFNRLGKNVGELYAINSLGANIGSFAAGFFLIPLLGIRNSSLFAASLNFIAAMVIFVYIKKQNKVVQEESSKDI